MNKIPCIFDNLPMSNTIRAKDIMNTQVSITEIHTTIKNTAKKMREIREDYVVVVEDDIPVGIVTSDDLISFLAEDNDHSDNLIEEIMISDVITSGPEQTVWDLIDVMYARGIARIPIIDEYEKIKGIVDFSDLLKVLYMKKNPI